MKLCNNCWCGGDDNRYHKLITTEISLDECKKRCDHDAQCQAVEYWPNEDFDGTKICYKCNNPGYHPEYTDTTDPNEPPSVYRKGTHNDSFINFSTLLTSARVLK